jgi:hypothetical protein
MRRVKASLILTFLALVVLLLIPSASATVYVKAADIKFGGSTLQIRGDYTFNKIVVYSNYVLIYMSTPPSYVLSFPYTWVDSISAVNISAPSTPKTAALSYSTTAYGAGVKIYGCSGGLSATPTWDEGNKRLSFATLGPGTVKIYTGTLGKPYYISVDGVIKTEGQGWSWDGTNNLVTVTGSTNYIVSWTPQSQETPAGPGGGGGFSVITTTTTTTSTATLPSAPTIPSEVYAAPPDLLTLGMVSLVAIISIVLVWQEIQKRLSPHSLWNQRLKKINRKVKWKKRRYW